MRNLKYFLLFSWFNSYNKGFALEKSKSSASFVH